MTGIVKHAENAVKARRELAAVKAQASEVIGSLIGLIKCMYLFGDLEEMEFECRPVGDVIADLLSAESATEMLSAMTPPPIARNIIDASLAASEGE